MTDIGTGSYTIIGQTAAEMMGVPLDKVVVRLGDSRFPVSCRIRRSMGRATVRPLACMPHASSCAKPSPKRPASILRRRCSRMARSTRAKSARRWRSCAGDSGITAEDSIEFGVLDKQERLSTFGAHFVEVGVHAATGETRVRRMLAVCAAGRILNPKSARSQIIGAMAMGVGAALMEELAIDKRHGFFVNHDLAGYEVPVHADIPHQDVIFLEEADDRFLAHEGARRRRARHLRHWCGRRQRDLQRHRRSRARLPDHARQAACGVASLNRGLSCVISACRRTGARTHERQSCRMRYLALCTDYDGTIAHHGRVDKPTIAALEELRAVRASARPGYWPGNSGPAKGLRPVGPLRTRGRRERCAHLPAGHSRGAFAGRCAS